MWVGESGECWQVRKDGGQRVQLKLGIRSASGDGDCLQSVPSEGDGKGNDVN
jgi:hypothetical protein